jgi:hypothetical protein
VHVIEFSGIPRGQAKRMNTRLTGLLALAVAAGLLAGCNEAESGRPLTYEKGVYKGKQDEPLSGEAREQLRQRMSIQGGGGL